MGEGARDLARLVRDELTRPPPPGAATLAREIQRRIGPSTAAVVFYGSCLRRGSDEGVLDFYAAVDDLAAGSPSRWLAWAGRWLPPNVFYLECPGAAGALRTKYAVLSVRDLARGAAPGGLRTGVWARFCQPVLAAYRRDAAALDALVEVGVQSILTAIQRIAPLLEGPASPEQLWQRVFRETYAAEMRTESEEAIAGLYRADPARYDRAARAALAELGERGILHARWEGARFMLDASGRARAGRAWRRKRPLAKLAYLAQLLKTAFTFGDWLPYALWKVERHTGTRTVPSERQRRHPLIFGWPLLFRLLRNRDLR